MTPDEIKPLLPAVFHPAIRDGSPLLALLQVMSNLHEPIEKDLQTLERYFSPYHTPEDFLPYLGSWLLLDQYYSHTDDGGQTDFPAGSGQLRELIANFVQIAQWRGTPRGLIQMLELATGCPGFRIDEQTRNERGDVRQFHMRVIAPPSAQSLRNTVESIISTEKPAYVTFEIQFLP